MIDDWWEKMTPEAKLRLALSHRATVERAVKNAMDFNQAMNLVRTLSDLDEEELKEIEESARKLMRESPKSIGPDEAIRNAAEPYYSGRYVSKKARRERRQS